MRNCPAGDGAVFGAGKYRARRRMWVSGLWFLWMKAFWFLMGTINMMNIGKRICIQLVHFET